MQGCARCRRGGSRAQPGVSPPKSTHHFLSSRRPSCQFSRRRCVGVLCVRNRAHNQVMQIDTDVRTKKKKKKGEGRLKCESRRPAPSVSVPSARRLSNICSLFHVPSPRLNPLGRLADKTHLAGELLRNYIFILFARGMSSDVGQEWSAR